MTLPQLLVPILMAAATPAASAPAADTPPPTKLEFPLAGFRINVLEPAKESPGGFSISFPVPGNGTTYPSVGVQRQPTMKERPSLQNFQDAKTIRAHNGDTVLMERAPSAGEWRMEYTSTMPVMGIQPVPKLHVYQRVCSINGITYVVSATSLDTEWAALGPQLKAGVDSFELSSAPAPGKASFPRLGFRINKIDRTVPKDKKQLLLAMGFVSVGVEPCTKTLKDYQAEQEASLIKDPKNKILRESTPAENSFVVEYVQEAIPATKQRPAILSHCYEKVVLAHGQLYRAVGHHFDWDKDATYEQVKACVDSLEVMPIPAPAPATTAAPAPASAPVAAVAK